ncbi:MAG TPA: N-acetyltransferase [Blastocatellia bacterium]|nr:N-acetyltransferase [Blastocatellia bacterium]
MAEKIDFIIRSEELRDHQAIFDVNKSAFGSEGESKLVEQLRSDDDLVISLVAEVDGRVIGHIAMSKMSFSCEQGDVPALALAPVSVLPDFQKRGIGSALIKKAIEMASETGANAIRWNVVDNQTSASAGSAETELSKRCNIVFVLGHKEYYPRFGFSADMAKDILHPFPKDSFMALELNRGRLGGVRGKVKYPKAFDLAPEWTIRSDL